MGNPLREDYAQVKQFLRVGPLSEERAKVFRVSFLLLVTVQEAAQVVRLNRQIMPEDSRGTHVRAEP